MRTALVAIALALATPAASQELGTQHVDEVAPEKRRDAAQVSRDGTFLPTTWSARIGDQRVAAFSQGGYDTAPGEGGVFSTIVEGAIVNRVAIRAGIEYVPSLEEVAVSAGLRVGILRQEKHKIDLGLAAMYKNRGFSEADGEIEVAVLLARRWGRLGTFANVIYGQGVNPGERDAEIRLAALWTANEHMNIGIDARARLDLGEHDAERDTDKLENDFDLIAGPMVNYAVSHLVLSVQAGVHAVVQREVGNAGFVAIGGVGTAF
jgi:hypothetical protein